MHLHTCISVHTSYMSMFVLSVFVYIYIYIYIYAHIQTWTQPCRGIGRYVVSRPAALSGSGPVGECIGPATADEARDLAASFS